MADQEHPTPSRRASLGPLGRWVPLGLTAALLLLADQLTKAWALDRLCLEPAGSECLVHSEPIHVLWTLQWNLAFNTGMAFSQGREAGPIIGLVVIVIVVVLLFFARRLTSRLQLVLVGVVVGGALGNLVDRLLRAEEGFMSGAVVDFVDVRWWPIFNVADAAVVLGGLALALTGFTTEHSTDDDAAAADAGERSDTTLGGGATGAEHGGPERGLERGPEHPSA